MPRLYGSTKKKYHITTKRSNFRHSHRQPIDLPRKFLIIRRLHLLVIHDRLLGTQKEHFSSMSSVVGRPPRDDSPRSVISSKKVNKQQTARCFLEPTRSTGNFSGGLGAGWRKGTAPIGIFVNDAFSIPTTGLVIAWSRGCCVCVIMYLALVAHTFAHQRSLFTVF